MEIRVLNAHEARAQVGALADVLLDCVEGGASVSFMAGFSKTNSVAFFEKVAAGVASDHRIHAIVLKPQSVTARWAKLQEVRQELLDFKTIRSKSRASSSKKCSSITPWTSSASSKQSGMFWAIRGANAIFALCCFQATDALRITRQYERRLQFHFYVAHSISPAVSTSAAR
jgi:hypothetical protein